MSSTTKHVISSARVKEILGANINKDVNEQIDLLNDKMKQYRQFSMQLRTGKEAVYTADKDGKRVKVLDEVPVLDSNGVQKMKTVTNKETGVKSTVPETRSKVRQEELTAKVREEKQKYVDEFRATKFDALSRKISAYKQHKVRFSKNAIKLLITFVEKMSLAWLNLAADQALKISLEQKKDIGKKLKIRLLHLLKCEYLTLPGIKAFFGKAFFEALGAVHAEEVVSATKTGAADEKSRLKKEGYTKSSAAREKVAQQKKQAELEKIREEAEKYKGLTYEEVCRMKEREVLSESQKKKKSSEAEAEKPEKVKEDLVFANAIKRKFKEETNGSYSVSSEVSKFFERSILEFMSHVSGAALADLEANDNKTYDVEEMLVFLVGISSSSLNVVRKFTLNEIEIVDEEALEQAREERKAKLEQGIYEKPIDKSTLPKSEGFEAIPETTYDGSFAAAYSCLHTVVESLEEDSKKSQEKKKAAAKKPEKTDNSERVEKVSHKKATKKQDSDSEEEEEVQKVKVKKTRK